MLLRLRSFGFVVRDSALLKVTWLHLRLCCDQNATGETNWSKGEQDMLKYGHGMQIKRKQDNTKLYLPG